MSEEKKSQRSCLANAFTAQSIYSPKAGGAKGRGLHRPACLLRAARLITRGDAPGRRGHTRLGGFVINTRWIIKHLFNGCSQRRLQTLGQSSRVPEFQGRRTERRTETLTTPRLARRRGVALTKVTTSRLASLWGSGRRMSRCCGSVRVNKEVLLIGRNQTPRVRYSPPRRRGTGALRLRLMRARVQARRGARPAHTFPQLLICQRPHQPATRQGWESAANQRGPPLKAAATMSWCCDTAADTPVLSWWCKGFKRCCNTATHAVDSFACLLTLPPRSVAARRDVNYKNLKPQHI